MESKKETAVGLEGVTNEERNLLSGPLTGEDKAHVERQKAKQSAAEEASPSKKEGARKERHLAVRILTWVLLKSIVPALCIVAIIGGMYTGYKVLGKQPGDEIFKLDTWKHMYDLIFAE